MICPITNTPCKTNGCGEKCYKRDTLDYPKSDVKQVNTATDFEKDLYKLINKYVSNGLKKKDIINKMEYVTQSCRVS